MTSKEALEKLINKTGIINDTCAHLLACVKYGKCKFEEPIETCADYQLVMTIEKELEILDIIKRSIFSKETHKYVLNEKFKGQKFMTIGLSIRGDNDINKIKECLENE